MTTPKQIKDGAQILTKTVPLEDINLVIITPYPNEIEPTFDVYKRHIETYLDFTIPQKKVFPYVPPRFFQDQKIGRSTYPREENIPQISDPTKTYIIIDDIFEKGTTLKCTLNALVTKGLEKDNIWFYTNDICGKYMGIEEPGYLDKAEAFLQYRKENPLG